MPEGTVWFDAVIVSILAVFGFLFKAKVNKIDVIDQRLSDTREAMARDHVTRPEMTENFDKLMDRLERNREYTDLIVGRLDAKIDKILARLPAP